jgi:hypothetical protein
MYVDNYCSLLREFARVYITNLLINTTCTSSRAELYTYWYVLLPHIFLLVCVDPDDGFSWLRPCHHVSLCFIIYQDQFMF